MSSTLFASYSFENYQLLGEAPSSKNDAKFTECFADLVDFLYITIGAGFTKPGSDFSDYWRDFFLYTSHYADVYGVERQLNSARYSVISTYLKCQTTRFKQVKSQYYSLEAELYFVRHFISTDPLSEGFPDVITVDEKRKQFQQDFFAYMKSKSPDTDDEDTQIAVFGGYFDRFMAKYKNKVNEYRDNSNSSDPAWGRLKEKWENLMKTIKGFGSSVEGLGGDASDLGKALVPNTETISWNSLMSRLDACAETSSESYCASDAVKYLQTHDALKEAKDKLKSIFESKRKNSVSFDEVQFAVDTSNQPSTDIMSEAEMLNRYEVLYGTIGTSGLKQMMQSTDTLLATLKDGRGEGPFGPKIPGSLKPLAKIAECANNVEDKECK